MNSDGPFTAASCSDKSLQVFMRAVTWGRDSHGLFDYESRHITKKNLRTQTSGKLVRFSNDIEFLEPSFAVDLANADNRHLINLISEQGQYFIEGVSETNQQPDKLWLVVRSLKQTQGYEITGGDVIKLGRVKFKVKEFWAEKCSYNEAEEEACEELDLRKVSRAASEPESEEPKICRICWTADDEDANPLIAPCRCSGTVGYIHYQCLKEWLRSKMLERKNPGLHSQYWKVFECDLCKMSFPYTLSVCGSKYPLVDFPQPENVKQPYIVIQSQMLDKNSSRMVHAITPQLAEAEPLSTFKLGRGHDSDVRVNDISVSRCHALLKYRDGAFAIEDNMSKFGTLVQVREKVELIPGTTKAIQVGRTVVSL